MKRRELPKGVKEPEMNLMSVRENVFIRGDEHPWGIGPTESEGLSHFDGDTEALSEFEVFFAEGPDEE